MNKFKNIELLLLIIVVFIFNYFNLFGDILECAPIGKPEYNELNKVINSYQETSCKCGNGETCKYEIIYDFVYDANTWYIGVRINKIRLINTDNTCFSCEECVRNNPDFIKNITTKIIFEEGGKHSIVPWEQYDLIVTTYAACMGCRSIELPWNSICEPNNIGCCFKYYKCIYRSNYSIDDLILVDEIIEPEIECNNSYCGQQCVLECDVVLGYNMTTTHPKKIQVEKQLNENKTIITPNPANNEIKLNYNYNETGLVKIEIYDVSGNKIYTDSKQKNTIKDEFIVNSNKFNSGKYFFNIKIEEIIIEKGSFLLSK